MANTNHPYTVRTITEDGILVTEDSDFNEDARWDFFEETVRQSKVGEIVQLINDEDNHIVAETRVE